MLALGVILILLAAAAVLAATLGASDELSSFDLGAFSLEMNTLGVFLFGAVTVVLLGLGLMLVRGGVRRANRRRQEKKELTRLAHRDEAAESAHRPTTGTAAPRTDAPGTGGDAGPDSARRDGSTD